MHFVLSPSFSALGTLLVTVDVAQFLLIKIITWAFHEAVSFCNYAGFIWNAHAVNGLFRVHGCILILLLKSVKTCLAEFNMCVL